MGSIHPFGRIQFATRPGEGRAIRVEFLPIRLMLTPEIINV
jgi:hypothetical protein